MQYIVVHYELFAAFFLHAEYVDNGEFLLLPLDL
jgi:hypothetical protein